MKQFWGAVGWECSSVGERLPNMHWVIHTQTPTGKGNEI